MQLQILSLDGAAWSAVIAYTLVIIFDVGGCMFGLGTLAGLVKEGGAIEGSVWIYLAAAAGACACGDAPPQRRAPGLLRGLGVVQHVGRLTGKQSSGREVWRVVGDLISQGRHAKQQRRMEGLPHSTLYSTL